MAAPSNSRLQSMLQAAVQSVQWTYSIFWQLCPQQGSLRWGDGYYNGAIKTRKTVQATEVISSEEASVERSQQLRELYELLSGGETERQSRWPCAALSPEDLTESEWFYLLCVSFSFHPGEGLPGMAYARKQHLWLTGASEVDSQTFSRAILAKSANIQTVMCIPLLEGVVEFGTTDKVQEDLDLIQHVKSFFIDHRPPPPKPALSEHSTCSLTSPYPAIAAVNVTNHCDMSDDKEEAKLVSQAEIGRNSFTLDELMGLDTLEDIRVGSSGDGSNHLDSYPEESTHMWGPVEEPVALAGSVGLELLQLQQPASDIYPGDDLQSQNPRLCKEQVVVPSEDMAQSDTHYSQTVSTILQNTCGCWPESPAVDVSHLLTDSFESAFTKGSPGAVDHRLHVAVTSQWVLRYILFSVPYLHANNHQDLPQTQRVKGAAHQEASVGHVLAERRRREKLNERFIILRSLVPFVTKTDKASILGDTIEYVKQLRVKMQDLEARNRQMEADQRRRRKRRVREVDPVLVEVSIIEGDAVLEVECTHREGLLVDVMRTLRELGLEVTVVQSSVKDEGVFVAELRANVKESANGKKASIVEVKKALSQIIPPSSSIFSGYCESFQDVC